MLRGKVCNDEMYDGQRTHKHQINMRMMHCYDEGLPTFVRTTTLSEETDNNTEKFQPLERPEPQEPYNGAEKHTSGDDSPHKNFDQCTSSSDHTSKKGLGDGQNK